jgi:hypothetical protein
MTGNDNTSFLLMDAITEQLWLAKRADVRNGLLSILPLWSPEPVARCALFNGPARLTPKKCKCCSTFRTNISELIGPPGSIRI